MLRCCRAGAARRRSSARLLAGDAETGVTIMQMEAGLDTGPMLLERGRRSRPRETAGDAARSPRRHSAAQALLETLAQCRGRRAAAAAGRRRDLRGKIRKEEALIDWTRSAREIDRQVRAFNPWPVAETRWNGRQLRIWEATPLDRPPGPQQVR